MPQIHIERSFSFFLILKFSDQFTDVEPVADLDSAQTLIEPLLPSKDFGTSTTIAITFVPANVSLPGLLNEDAVPAITCLKRTRSKKNGSSRGPANAFTPLSPVAVKASWPYLVISVCTESLLMFK